MDIFEASAEILSIATSRASHARIMALHRHLRQDEIRWLLTILVDKGLLELDSSASYWTTVNGFKFLHLQFNMQRVLRAQKSLI